MLKQLSEAPGTPLILGFAGLVPFFAGAFGIALGGPAAIQAANFLPIYAAVILSFLAGGRWTAEIVLRADAPRTGVLLLAVALALGGWLAVLLQVWNRPGLPFDTELAGWGILIAGFVIQYLWDRGAVRGGTLPRWYLPLRLVLTLGAVIGLGAALAIRAL
jgi:putative flippase GtrA